MSLSHSPRIVTDGLVLALDAANPKSYVGSGNTWTDLSGKGNNGTINGAVHFGPNPTVSSAYSVSAVNGGTADFTSSPDGSNTAIFSNIFDGTNSTYFYNAQSNFDVTVTLVEPITYTSRTVSVYHATLNAVDFITTAGTVTAQTGGQSTGTFTYTNLLPAGGTLTGIRFYTLSPYSNNTVVSITIDGELLNLFKPTPQISSYFDFDGTNDYISISDSDSFTFGSKDFTVECWVYNQDSGNRKFIIGQSNSNGQNVSVPFSLYKTSGNKLEGTVCVDANFYNITSPTDLPSNTWVHCALVRNGTTTNLYMNGILQGTSSSVSTSSINDSSNQLSIGRLGEYNADYWNGKISSVKMYKGKGLTAEEVQQNYNALKGRYTT